MASEWISDKEAALRLGLTRQGLYLWRRKGKGPPYFRIEGRVRYRVTDFEEWLNQQRSR